MEWISLTTSLFGVVISLVALCLSCVIYTIQVRPMLSLEIEPRLNIGYANEEDFFDLFVYVKVTNEGLKPIEFKLHSEGDCFENEMKGRFTTSAKGSDGEIFEYYHSEVKIIDPRFSSNTKEKPYSSNIVYHLEPKDSILIKKGRASIPSNRKVAEKDYHYAANRNSASTYFKVIPQGRRIVDRLFYNRFNSITKTMHFTDLFSKIVDKTRGIHFDKDS